MRTYWIPMTYFSAILGGMRTQSFSNQSMSMRDCTGSRGGTCIFLIVGTGTLAFQELHRQCSWMGPRWILVHLLYLWLDHPHIHSRNYHSIHTRKLCGHRCIRDSNQSLLHMSLPHSIWHPRMDSIMISRFPHSLQSMYLVLHTRVTRNNHPSRLNRRSSSWNIIYETGSDDHQPITRPVVMRYRIIGIVGDSHLCYYLLFIQDYILLYLYLSYCILSRKYWKELFYYFGYLNL